MAVAGPRCGEPAVDGASLSISVVIPTYCRSATLSDAVSVYLGESAVDEVVIVDDGSTDDTPAVCARLAESDRRVRVLRTTNGGASAARAAGAAFAISDVVMFIDDDTIGSAELVEGHRARHQELGPGAVVAGYYSVDPPAVPSRRQFPARIYQSDYDGDCRRFEAGTLDVLDSLHGGNFSVRRDLYLHTTPVRRDLPYHEDHVLGLQLRDLGASGTFDRSLRSLHRHSRTVEEFWRDAFRQGRALAMLASSRSIASEGPVTGAPARLRPLVRLLAQRDARAGRWLLRGVIRLLGLVRCWGMEERAARLYRHVERQRGYESESSA